MDTLDANNFRGTFRDAAAAGLAPVGEARFDGFFVTTFWSRDAAVGLLPQGLCLADPIGRASVLHPVIFAIGIQSDTAVLFGGMRWPTGFRYCEVATIVPFVRHESGLKLHLCVPTMYAGDRVATWAGNTHYGYNKVHTPMKWLGGELIVADPAGAPVVRASCASEAQWVRANASPPPALRALIAVARLPVAGRRADGSFVASYFHWDVSEATVRPARATVVLQLPSDRSVRTCEGADDATFEVQGMRWRVSWPGQPAF